MINLFATLVRLTTSRANNLIVWEEEDTASMTQMVMPQLLTVETSSKRNWDSCASSTWIGMLGSSMSPNSTGTVSTLGPTRCAQRISWNDTISTSKKLTNASRTASTSPRDPINTSNRTTYSISNTNLSIQWCEYLQTIIRIEVLPWSLDQQPVISRSHRRPWYLWRDLQQYHCIIMVKAGLTTTLPVSSSTINNTVLINKVQALLLSSSSLFWFWLFSSCSWYSHLIIIIGVYIQKNGS